eukprot:TRINITY_DN20582_c0_g1_i1.p1 TRINITY_DN20582_c0_g1~~TRINITY_DN20582_c0_g1_i1.p1  ORF type:complete len:386 (+),score=89.22 TRINITY_DN20582_c0_g1_i1:58-1158(+)
MSCCQGGPCESEKTLKSVEEYYGKVLSTTKDLKTSACTAAGRPHRLIREYISKVPKGVREKFYGCGAPLPLGIEGLRVLDLGSGSGRDCYVCAKLVGEGGEVVGVDMTKEQLEVADRFKEEYCKDVLGYKQCNLRFVEGYIEKLPSCIEDNSFNIITSNCVINLSPDKPAVLREAYRVLAPGGEFYFSDVYCDRRLPKTVQNHEILWGECIAGSLYIEDFIREAHKAGFTDPRELSRSEIEVTDPELSEICGNARFYSITYRLFKLPGLLETKCEDYGQFAVYKGTIPGNTHSYTLDDHHTLVTNKPFLVCGNTAAMLGEGNVSWLSKHFTITGDRSVHYGLFDCSPASSSQPAKQSCDPAGGSCC